MPDYRDTVETVPGIPGQYITGGNVFEGQPFEYPPDPVYAQILRAVVLTCVDIVFVSPEGQVLIGMRSREPQPDWWVIGGRMRPGQSYESAAVHNTLRELMIEITPDQLSFLGVYSYIWANNAQAGAHGGSHTVSVTLVCQVTAGQIEAMQIGDEYSTSMWVRPRDIVDADEGYFHPGLVQTMRDFIAR